MYDELESITGKHQRRCIPTPEELHRTHWVVVSLRAAFSPLMRFQDVPRPTGWVWSTVMSLLQLIWSSMFGSLMVLSATTAVIDYAAGAFVAARQKRFSTEIARNGLVGKLMGYALCLLVYVGEFWVQAHVPSAPDSNGYGATFLLMCLWTVDLQSIEKHRRALGFGPIPGLSHALDWFRGLVAARIPPAPPSPAPVSDLELPPPESGVQGGTLPSPAFDRPRSPNGGP